MLLPLSNNLFGFYDKLLSFHFFTADLNYYNVIIGDNLKDKLPKHIKQFYRTKEGHTYIQMNEWAQKDNKVLFYPQERIINYMEAYLRSFADNPSGSDVLELEIYNNQGKE